MSVPDRPRERSRSLDPATAAPACAGRSGAPRSSPRSPLRSPAPPRRSRARGRGRAPARTPDARRRSPALPNRCRHPATAPADRSSAASCEQQLQAQAGGGVGARAERLPRVDHDLLGTRPIAGRLPRGSHMQGGTLPPPEARSGRDDESASSALTSRRRSRCWRSPPAYRPRPRPGREAPAAPPAPHTRRTRSSPLQAPPPPHRRAPAPTAPPGRSPRPRAATRTASRITPRGSLACVRPT